MTPRQKHNLRRAFSKKPMGVRRAANKARPMEEIDCVIEFNQQKFQTQARRCSMARMVSQMMNVWLPESTKLRSAVSGVRHRIAIAILNCAAALAQCRRITAAHSIMERLISGKGLRATLIYELCNLVNDSPWSGQLARRDEREGRRVTSPRAEGERRGSGAIKISI